QLVLRKSPLEAGLLIIPMDIATLAAGPLSGLLSDKYGHLPFTTAGLATISLSLVLFATTDASTPYSVFVAYLILFGAGLGFFASPNISSIMGSVPPERRGIASGFRATFFNVGYTISLNLAILITTFTIPYALVTQVIGSGGIGISEANMRWLATSTRERSALVPWDGSTRVRGCGVGLPSERDPCGVPIRLLGGSLTFGNPPKRCGS